MIFAQYRLMDTLHMSHFEIWPHWCHITKFDTSWCLPKIFKTFGEEIKGKNSPVLEKLAITVPEAKTLVLSLIGSYYTKKNFQLYFGNRTEIIFLLMGNTTLYESFCNLTPLVSYYKIWPFMMFAKKFQDIWSKNQSHI